MNTPAYEVVFDIERSGYRGWPGVLFGLLFVAIGIGAVLGRKRLAEGRHPRFVLVFTIVWLSFSSLMTVFVSVGSWKRYARLRDARATQSFVVVEGTVSEFKKPMENRKRVGFVVDGTRFQYSPYGFESSFDEWHWYGGPIEDGLRVRIGHVHGAIVKLEIAR